MASLGERALEIVKHLSGEIGPRPAGSEGERRALEYAEGLLRRAGAKVERQEVRGIPSPLPFRALRVVGLVALVGSVWDLRRSPWSVWIYLACFFLLPRLVSAARKRLAASSERASFNLIGRHEAEEERATLILCAHIDTARASRVPGEALPRIHRLLQRAWLPFIALASALALVRHALGSWLPMPEPLWLVIWRTCFAYAVIFAAFELGYMALSWGKGFSPGANDNASGVAVVLALAERFAVRRPKHLSLLYVLFTAEEVGLVGSERFAKGWPLDRGSTYALNLDMVGCGRRLHYVRGSWAFPPRRTDRRLNGLLRRACPGIRGRWYWVGRSDFYSLLGGGIPACSLGAEGDRRRDVVYHTERDTADRVSAEALELAGSAVEALVRSLDETSEV